MLDKKKITEEYNTQSATFRKWADETGLNQLLRDLSKMIGDMKEAGLDVALDMIENPSERAFNLFGENRNRTTPLSGILHIGSMQKLLAITVVENEQPCLKLGVSDFDIRFNGASPTLRAKVYDIKNDADAMIKLQKEIIRLAARTAIIRENDVAESFGEKRSGLRKGGLKPL